MERMYLSLPGETLHERAGLVLESQKTDENGKSPLDFQLLRPTQLCDADQIVHLLAHKINDHMEVAAEHNLQHSHVLMRLIVEKLHGDLLKKLWCPVHNFLHKDFVPQ